LALRKLLHSPRIRCLPGRRDGRRALAGHPAGQGTLLDEIEKASPFVFDTLLGVCDEGRLSSSFFISVGRMLLRRRTCADHFVKRSADAGRVTGPPWE
jgi:hypothetical protein